MCVCVCEIVSVSALWVSEGPRKLPTPAGSSAPPAQPLPHIRAYPHKRGDKSYSGWSEERVIHGIMEPTAPYRPPTTGSDRTWVAWLRDPKWSKGSGLPVYPPKLVLTASRRKEMKEWTWKVHREMQCLHGNSIMKDCHHGDLTRRSAERRGKKRASSKHEIFKESGFVTEKNRFFKMNGFCSCCSGCLCSLSVL